MSHAPLNQTPLNQTPLNHGPASDARPGPAVSTLSADADHIIAQLGLQPHPEGGWFAEVYRSPAAAGERGALTTIYFLLKAGERSHWHRVDACEVWHHYAGAPLALDLAADDDSVPERHLLGLDAGISGGVEDARPVQVVPAGWWQAACSLGAWTLAGCTVAPAFLFEGFELAPPGWAPGHPRPDGGAGPSAGGDGAS
ncbi:MULTISPECIES: cupin domain-containing protein [Tistrella]|uniref:cupin domain-containing protein n=1 Tax=Tistrella TaxID=171436 RepID=UPI0031F671F1